MEYEQIRLLGQKSGNEKYAKFLFDEGWRYETEADALAGYGRLERSLNGTLLSEEEFLAELEAEGDAAVARQLYTVLLSYVKKGALSPRDVYNYARFRWCVRCPEAVSAYQIGPSRWKVNNCSEPISEDQASQLINSVFGFDTSRVRLLGTPYYDASDWNFICFRCGPYDWLISNGELHQIYQ